MNEMDYPDTERNFGAGNNLFETMRCKQCGLEIDAEFEKAKPVSELVKKFTHLPPDQDYEMVRVNFNCSCGFKMFKHIIRHPE